MSRGTRRLMAVVIAVVTCSSWVAVPASARRTSTGGGGTTTVGTPNGNFSCRAELARLEGKGLLAGINADLNWANAPGDPCKTDFAGISGQLNASSSLYSKQLITAALLSADIKVLHGGTQLLSDVKHPLLPRKAVAEAGVALLKIDVLGSDIEVAVLTSNAKAKCDKKNQPYLKGDSTVAGLKINRLNEEIPNGHSHISLYASLAASLEVKAMFQGLFADAELDLMLKESLTLHLNHQEAVSGSDFPKLTVRSLWLESGIIGDVIISESIAGYNGNPCTTTTGAPPPPPPPSAAKGWMTGGGRINDTNGGKVTHGMRLECTPASGQNNLQVNWAGGGFHLTEAKEAACNSGPDGVNRSGNPTAGFDTLIGSGIGRCNGETAYAKYTIIDNGEPGTADTFTIDVSGSCNLRATGTLERGNHQAHGRP